MDDGLGPFDQKEYDELDLDEYRRRFPAETEGLTNEQVWHAVSYTEDDLSDDEWRARFAAAKS